jgi:hypothetical protein
MFSFGGRPETVWLISSINLEYGQWGETRRHIVEKASGEKNANKGKSSYSAWRPAQELP